MQKATFSITKTKKGKPLVNLIFENNKVFPLQNFVFAEIESLHGKKVDVEKDKKGQVVRIVMDGKEIFSSVSVISASTKTPIPESLKVNHASNITKPATAPYNFVPLNEKVVLSETIPDFDKYYVEGEDKRYTGHVSLSIETKRPLFIRGTLTETEISNKLDDSRKKPDFFSPADKIRIPGSSLRGMIRTLVEIMSYGTFECFDNKRLYFRGMADSAVSLRKYYQKKIGTVSAGILSKEKLDYFIEPTSFSKIPKSEARLKITALGELYEEFKFYDLGTGFLVVSGKMQGKNNDWLVNKKNGTGLRMKISKDDIDAYTNDINREKNAPNLTEEAKSGDIPCFFVIWKDKDGEKSVSFGHTKMFRIAYQTTIGDHVPESLRKESLIDIPKAIFGNEDTFAGRLFFEDAFLTDPTDKDCKDEKVVTLLGPKPTTFQHYLVQTDPNISNHPINLAHYDSNPLTAIRGHKLYWHKENAKFKNGDFDPNIDSKIRPVTTGKAFEGRIRFENLSKVELGALLSAIDLPAGCCHKLGMGKPLGLGSIKIVPTLYLSNRKLRYSGILAEWGTPVAESTAEGESISDFKKTFEAYILKELGEKTIADLWQLDRMQELEKILKFDSKSADNKTEYMPLAEFEERKVLPKSTEV